MAVYVTGMSLGSKTIVSVLCVLANKGTIWRLILVYANLAMSQCCCCCRCCVLMLLLPNPGFTLGIYVEMLYASSAHDACICARWRWESGGRRGASCICTCLLEKPVFVSVHVDEQADKKSSLDKLIISSLEGGRFSQRGDVKQRATPG